jgi:hypothetical protein
VPDPEFVIVPVLLTEVPDKVIPFEIELLLLSIKFPVPEISADIVNNATPDALLLTKVVPPDATVIAVVVIFVVKVTSVLTVSSSSTTTTA